jgi:hypothetical protein
VRLRIVVSNTYCVVFFCSCLSCVLCTVCCQFLWIVFVLFVLCFVYPMLPVSLDYPFFLLLFSIPWRLLDCAVNFPSLTNWFHFTIWETRIAETSRILYIYSPDAKSNKCVNPSPVYLRALHVLFGHSTLPSNVIVLTGCTCAISYCNVVHNNVT